jgi:class 3 adenylate cyclase
MTARILIVDDDEDVIALLRHFLAGAGYEVIHALGGVQALGISTRDAPDLVVSDVRMPEFDGFGLLAALRANATTRALPVVFLTVLEDAESVTRAMRLGVDGYLPKPVQRDALLETVAAKLQLSRGRLSTLEADSVDASEAVRTDDELLARDFELGARGQESRRASVLYSDIRRFTRIAEILTHQETADLLRDYYARAAAVIQRQRGTVVKYVGDALLAAFDATSGGQQDHAACAVRASILLGEAAAQFGRGLEERYPGRGLPKFGIGIGIHTGEVMVGSIGPERNAEVTVIGDTVNIAARLESATKRLGWNIVASDATVQAAGEHFVYGRRSLLVPRGRYASVEVREVKGFAARNEASRARVIPMTRPQPAGAAA